MPLFCKLHPSQQRKYKEWPKVFNKKWDKMIKEIDKQKLLIFNGNKKGTRHNYFFFYVFEMSDPMVVYCLTFLAMLFKVENTNWVRLA